jgi:hypothetical protein
MARRLPKTPPMSSNPIPDRDPIGDVFDGSLLKIDDQYLLGLDSSPDAETVIQGPLVVRYAVRFLDRPHLSIVPGLVVLDYGETLTGEEAWIFLTERSNLHPRADVLGYRNDGEDEMTMVKKLDLALPVQVLVYSDEDAIKPAANVTALIASDTASVPKRLLEYLPRYNTIADWQSDRDAL